MRTLLATLAIAAALLLTACGGDDGGSDDYASQLDDACAELQTQIRDLPAKQVDEDLTAEQTAELAAGYEEEFRAGVEELEPPADLEDGDRKLLAALEQAPEPGAQPDEYLASYEELAAIYSELGADGCSKRQTEQLEQLERFKDGLFETNAQDG